MICLKILTVAFNFISALIGAGLASGKEVAVFLGNANFFSIVLCGTLIGAFSYPFLWIGCTSNGQTQGALFKNKEWLGQAIIKTMNFVFLSTMLGGADSLLLEIAGIRYGSFITAVLTLIIFELGEKTIRCINAITLPLILVLLLVLLSKKHSPIQGFFTLSSPILYAGMNTSSAGIYASNMCKELKTKHIPIISITIALFTSLFLLVVRSIIIGTEHQKIPTYSVSVDTNLMAFGAIIIFASIVTSCLSSLKLSTTRHSMSPYVICSFALIVSMFGFENLIRFLYPALGVVGIIVLLIAFYRLLQSKLKICKNGGLGL